MKYINKLSEQVNMMKCITTYFFPSKEIIQMHLQSIYFIISQY